MVIWSSRTVGWGEVEFCRNKGIVLVNGTRGESRVVKGCVDGVVLIGKSNKGLEWRAVQVGT